MQEQKKQNEPILLDFQFKNRLCQKMYTCIPAYLHTCFRQNEPNLIIE